MLFRYNFTREQKVRPLIDDVEDETPGRLLLQLIRLLDQWFDGVHKSICSAGSGRLQIGYPAVSMPVGPFGDSYGLVLSRLNEQWPVQCFGTAEESGELVGISFAEDRGQLLLRQQSISGVWCEELLGLYLEIDLPDAGAADCMAALLLADEREVCTVALDWKYRDFLEGQQLSEPDTTLAFCYVTLADDEPSPVDGLTFPQKQLLWRLFLERQSDPLEFDWVWNSLNQDSLPDWAEWTLALYQVMNSLHYQFLCDEDQFRLLDGSGKRIYFSVDHASAAERVLMKILFPLNH